MMAGNPNWWSNMHPPQSALFPAQYVSVGSANSSLSLDSLQDHHHHHLQAQDPPQSSWSQLLLSGSSSSTTTGLSEENDDRLLGINLSQFQPNKKLENWEDQMILSVNPPPRLLSTVHDHVDHHHHHHHDVKQEASNNLIKSNLYGQGEDNIHHDRVDQLQADRSGCANNWSQVIRVSSPRSCITSSLGSNTNNNMFDFSYNNNKADTVRNQSTDLSSECNSTATGVVCKKPRVLPSSSQPPLKVRKEKLGDRITALHQLVSPFGKTDTASVLLEAIGYIRFLQSQIEALSSPYLGHASKNMRNNNQQYVDVEGAEKEKQKDLRSRGLCLVPVSCTHHVGSDNGADYWAPSNFGSGF